MQSAEGALTKRIDPLLCDLELPLTATFYPAGFPLRIATNSPHVLQAAGESWEPFPRLFETPPLDFRVVVEPGGNVTAEPRVRKQAHLLHYVSDTRNFAAGDCLTLSATFYLSEASVADHVRLRWFYLEAMAYMLLTQRYVVSLHAGCVARNGEGILICGKSASGKSTLSFACARAGFTFLSDDCTWLPLDSEASEAIGKPHMARFRPDAVRHFPELAGHLASLRPNGKRSIEVPTSLFPGVHTASRCPIGSLIFLDRESEGRPRLDRMHPEEAIPLLLADLPSYGPEVNDAHEKAIHRLAALPAWRLRYRTLEDAIRLLSALR
ncbi:MAG: Hpr(Ser) kinase/phosphatase [Candidatus Solibacter sp.]|nr:Hpr(Ser) kinase/phosphatase [Candidatus Solibacter sp.]